MKRVVGAGILTILLCVLGAMGDTTFGTHNPSWNVIESAINFPGTLIAKVVGPGHEFRQLVLPFIFSLLFYFSVFWTLMTMFHNLAKRDGSKQESRY